VSDSEHDDGFAQFTKTAGRPIIASIAFHPVILSSFSARGSSDQSLQSGELRHHAAGVVELHHARQQIV
jgi:hypothetical protein